MNSTLLQGIAGATSSARRGHNPSVPHRIRIAIAAAAAVALVACLSIYGAGYYLLPLDLRPYSAKHELLKPGGSIGLKLGILGTSLFVLIFLYALRKVVPFLRRGSARHWMDFHILAGVSAPVVIAFHASFKFRGIAGGAFWIMVAVAISGVIGRYLYTQIPRSMNAAELSLAEIQSTERELCQELMQQSLYSADRLNRISRMPSKMHVRDVGVLRAVGEMLLLDITLSFRIASLRRSSCDLGRAALSLGGIFPIANPEVEQVVRLLRKKSSLSKRIVFLDQTHRAFHLWHVVHRPFSYAFALLAILHIMVIMGLGFGKLGLH